MRYQREIKKKRIGSIQTENELKIEKGKTRIITKNQFNLVF